MKIKDGFLLNNIGENYIAMATGAEMLSFNAMISTNEVGAFIWRRLENDTDINSVIDAVCGEYNIDRDTASADTEEFIQKLREAGILEE